MSRTLSRTVVFWVFTPKGVLLQDFADKAAYSLCAPQRLEGLAAAKASSWTVQRAEPARFAHLYARWAAQISAARNFRGSDVDQECFNRQPYVSNTAPGHW